MKRVTLLAGICFFAASSNAQSAIKPGYITRIPAAYKKCGAMYTYDSMALTTKKYILLTDFQNLGLMMINGKTVPIQLTSTKVTGTLNTSTYTGSGYTIVIAVSTTGQSGISDLESGQLTIIKGKGTIVLKIHGVSHCDETSQEGNQ